MFLRVIAHACMQLESLPVSGRDDDTHAIPVRHKAALCCLVEKVGAHASGDLL